jgi:3-oxoadipate enol-lactonase
MPIVQSFDGCPINYQMEGSADAPVLMLCNSLGTNLHMWDDQAAAWSKHFRLVRYDRRGHGQSGAPKGPYSMDMLGRDALAVADAAGAKTFNWCGLSMGGMVGQWMGANARDRVQRLVLSNTHYYYADKQPWHDRIKFAKDNGLEKLSGPQMERWFTKEFRDRSPQAVSKVVTMFVATKLDGFIGCCEAVRDIDFRATTPTISAPTMVIVGSKDPATLPEYGEAIQKMVKGAKLTSLEAAHLSNIEQPNAYTDAVLAFLTQK